MYRTTAERFAKACEMAGRSQASVISELMDAYSASAESERGKILKESESLEDAVRKMEAQIDG